MKKYLVILCTSLMTLYGTTSFATGLFVGADYLSVHAKHKAKNSSSTSDPLDGQECDADNSGYGVNAGIRGDVLNLLGSVEFFYDDLRTSTRTFDTGLAAASGSDTLNLKHRYGAKVNAGFAILPHVTPYATLGLANVRYSNQLESVGKSSTKYEMAPLYGVGVLVDLVGGLSLKASYDYQQFSTQYAYEGPRVRTRLGVAKIGLVYNF